MAEIVWGDIVDKMSFVTNRGTQSLAMINPDCYNKTFQVSAVYCSIISVSFIGINGLFQK